MVIIAERQAPLPVGSQENPAELASKFRGYRERLIQLGNFLCGCVLALSAPGFDQWYLAWIGLSPLLVSCFVGPSAMTVFWRGMCFGVGYYLVYCNWVAAIHPLNWLGFNDWQSIVMVIGGYVFMVLTQSVNVAVFSLACRMLPCTRSTTGSAIRTWWWAPIAIPSLWLLCINRLGNAHLLMGFHSDLSNRWTIPWGMFEYSQYRQDGIIQLASVIGGIGICFLIVLVNTLIAMLATTMIASGRLEPLKKPKGQIAILQVSIAAIGALLFSFGSGIVALLACFLFRPRFENKLVSNRPSRTFAWTQLFVVAITIVASTVWVCNTAQYSCQSYSPVTVLQANDNFRVRNRLVPTKPGYVLPFLSMIEDCPRGLCLGSETALPLPIHVAEPIKERLAEVAVKHGNDICVGCFDMDEKAIYNAACGISSKGKFLQTIHHKRYLVPFLEYTPSFFQPFRTALRCPETWIGFRHGTAPTVFDFSCGKVAPLICYEIISPELCASSVREGGQLLVCLGDQAWFRNSMIGNQMIAFCVMRAVENRRYVVFSSNTGPSAIVEPSGKIKRWSLVGKKQMMIDVVGYNSALTPFCEWISKLGRL